MCRFSLICGTAGRIAELTRLLQSITAQTFREFELLLIDQNSDNRVLRIIDALPDQQWVRRIVASPGLCRALNLGMEIARGEIIGFPDDDCWYPPDLLQKLSELFSEHPEWDGITLPTKDEQGFPSIARWASSAGRLTPSNLGSRGCSTSIFYRKRVCARIGSFDEAVGGGTSLLSPGSDMDYLHRVVRTGFHMEYQPHLMVNHPQTLPEGASSQARQKRYIYGYGEGSIARKYSLPLWYPAALIGFPLARAIKHAAMGYREKAILEWITFRGRLNGWMQTRRAP